MKDLNQTDIDVRLQLTSCCIGAMGTNVLKKIKIGAKDTNCKLQELQVVAKMLKYLKCYKVLDSTEVLSYGNILLVNLVLDDVVEFFINGISICGPQIVTTTNEATAMNALVTIINNYQTTYTAEYEGGKGHINITGTCSNDVITYTVTGTTEVVVAGLIGGICEHTADDNCLTEIQVKAMFDYISRKCKTCFQMPGFSYTS